MNFFFEDGLEGQKEFLIEDDQVHHFKNVGRGKAGDKVKIFNGKGEVVEATVLELSKKKIRLGKDKRSFFEKKENTLSLILGTPKKEYVESIFRSATQIGLSKIILLETKFSPYKFKAGDRYQKILKSAVVQSENPWIPEILQMKTITELEDLQGGIVIFSTEVKEKMAVDNFRAQYFFIGPEGGLHQEELSYLTQLEGVSIIRCDTPIMKAEVAVPYCAAVTRSLGASPK